MSDAFTIAEADHAMRNWSRPEPGAFEPSSKAHKRFFFRMLLDTHNPYKLAVINWRRPLSAATQCVPSLPILDIVVQSERRAAVWPFPIRERVGRTRREDLTAFEVRS